MTRRGQKCDNCQKKFDNIEGIYAIKFYHGKKDTDLFLCPVCYNQKKEEYLENYSVISFVNLSSGTTNIEEIKIGYIDCYAGRKDQNGQTLQQKDCSHCQPWEKLSENNVENKGISTEMKVLGILVNFSIY